MIREFKSLLMKPKKAMDALLESMTTDSYDSLGAHRRGEEYIPEAKGTEGESNHVDSVVIPSADLAQAPDPTDAEFFKESYPDVQEELQEHEFFKEAPEFEMTSSGVRRVQAAPTRSGNSPEWDQIHNILMRFGYKWLGHVSDGTEMWGKGGTEQFIFDPATKTWDHRTNGKSDLTGSLAELESKLEPKTSALKFCVACDCGDCLEHSASVEVPIEEKTAAEPQTKTAGKVLYHVCRTEKVGEIKAGGIKPLQPSNWVQGEDQERYGEGEIFAFTAIEDAVRWGGKMDWDFHQQMGTGKISIVSFDSGKAKWEVDTNDPLGQMGKKGKWLKSFTAVKPEQIKGAQPVTHDMIKAVVSGKSVKLGVEKEAGVKAYGMDVPLGDNDKVVSYGMGAPLGGTADPTSEPDDPAEDEQLNDEMNMQGALEKVASMTDVSWWAKSARPTDQKIQLLQKQLGLTPEQIELCIAADPSPQQKDFVATIAKWFAKKLVNLPEDTQKLKTQLDIFNKLKKSPTFQGNKDIQQYDPETLYQTVEQNQDAVSKKEKGRAEVSKGASIIVQDGDLTIYKVTDTKALMQLSGGTNWCTAHASHSNNYLKQGPSYVFFKNGSAFAQLHPASNQLMNRSDVCMVQEIEENWETIAKFVDDPTALRGLQLLAKQAPDVETWVKENATDQAQLVEILGRKMEEEAGKGTERRDMAVQWAIANGSPLGPKEEEMLPKRVPLNLLMRYGMKFHGGQPWAPLEAAILAAKEKYTEITDYALEFIKGRWAKGEQLLLRNAFTPQKTRGYTSGEPMRRVLDYAVRVVKNRWPELEKKFHTAASSKENAWGSAHYAIEVLKQRWTQAGVQPNAEGKFNEEEIIKASPRDWNLYSKAFMPGDMWEEFKQKVLETSGLSDENFNEQHDLWVVREWSTVKECVRSIGNHDADEALDAALDQESETQRSSDTPDEEDMVRQVVARISYAAMKRIGESLQSELPTEISRWAQQQGIAQVDFTDQQQLSALLVYFARYAPNCSVWQNIRKAFEQNDEANYRYALANDLDYELREGMYERGDDVYTELRFGPNFEERWNGDYNQAPCYEVLDRAGAVTMIRDGVDKDISDGQLELYVDADSTRQNMQENEQSNEEAYELMDRWYTQGVPREKDPNQMKLKFTSLLLNRKKALVQMHETPTMLPPRDDIKRHIDEQEQQAITDDVMMGVAPSAPVKGRPGMIDPRINPSGRAASKTADDYDAEQDMRDEYFLDEVNDAKAEAKRHFMEEEYIQQLCDDYIPPKTMDEMWKMMGEEYTAEFYGYPYKRVPDFTDQDPEGWEGKRLSSCPMCKSSNVQLVDEDLKGYKSASTLSECLDCRGFYSLSSH